MSAEDTKRRYRNEPWGKFLVDGGWEPYNMESTALDVAQYAVSRIIPLEAALRSLVEKFDNHPGIFGLFNEQPITISVTLGEWRRARAESMRNRYDAP